jgi:hypothetical protein
MEAILSSETLVITYKARGHHNPENTIHIARMLRRIF